MLLTAFNKSDALAVVVAIAVADTDIRAATVTPTASRHAIEESGKDGEQREEHSAKTRARGYGCAWDPRFWGGYG